MAASSFTQYYEACTWPLTSSTHCYTSKSSRNGDGRFFWATRKHVCWIDDKQKLCARRIPLRGGQQAYGSDDDDDKKKRRLMCVGYSAGRQWEVFSLMPQTYGTEDDSSPATKDQSGGAVSTTAPRSQSLIQRKSSAESLTSLMESSTSSLPTDMLMTKGESSREEHVLVETPSPSKEAATATSLDPNQMLLVLQQYPQQQQKNVATVYRLAVSVRPTALHLVEEQHNETAPPRLWWGSADDCYLHRSCVVEGTDSPSLTNDLHVKMETPVLALDGAKRTTPSNDSDDSSQLLLAAACQDGSVILVWEATGIVHRKIIIDGPIVAVQLGRPVDTNTTILTIGSLCGYVAQWTGDDPPVLLLDGLLLTAAGDEDSVLTVYFRPGEENCCCWLGTQSGRVLVVQDSKVVWACQLPYPVYGITAFGGSDNEEDDDGVLVVTQRSVHWLRSVQQAVTRARTKLHSIRQRLS